MAGDVAGGLRLYAELLAQLPRQRLWLRFARLNFSTRQLPFTRLIGMGRTPGQQNFALPLKDGGNNIDSFQHVRQ